MKSRSASNASFYDFFAHTYADLYGVLDAAETVRQWLVLLKELAPEITPPAPEPPKLIDVGCGPGWHVAQWAAAGYAAAGLDSSPRMLALARQALDEAGADQVTLYQANLLDVHPFSQDIGRYDLLVSHTNFPQLFSPRQLGSVAASLASISHAGTRWMLDLTSPTIAPNNRIQELFTDSQGIEWTATGTHLAAKRQYRITWHSGERKGVEYYWMHLLGQVDTILGSSGWRRTAWRSWHPHDRGKPWRKAGAASKRLVILYEFYS